MGSDSTYKELQPGTVLCGGKYTILGKIGEGGFGITYKAVQNGLNRTVCIKEFFPAGRCIRATHALTVYVQGTSEEVYEKYRQGFVKEAKMLATLRHPNIVEVIDVFDENNTSYMVMAFIEGRSLQSIVESRGRLPYPEAVNYIAQTADAVNYIHERHILHRDIKPDNIMITADYKAILIDFGSAREFEQDKTQMHTAMLTHGYAPTEQYTSKSRKGSYTDIYAIGATMYFVLTGEVPLEAAARLTEPMPEPRYLAPDIPDEANRTILKAMQLKAENRHQTVHEFMDDLRNARPSVVVDEMTGQESPANQSRTVQESTDCDQNEEYTGNERTKKKSLSKKIWICIAIAALAAAVIYVCYTIYEAEVDTAEDYYYETPRTEEAPSVDYYYETATEAPAEEATTEDYYYETTAEAKAEDSFYVNPWEGPFEESDYTPYETQAY